MGLKYQRVLLKLSGEALKGTTEVYDKKSLEMVAKQIIELTRQGVQLGIVVGGGNIWRGKLGEDLGMPQIEADYIGMMATIMNALALEASIQRLGYNKVVVYSALEVRTVSQPYDFKNARDKLENGYVVIFAGGTGFSYFTTDTAATIRAIEIGAQVLLMAKSGVAGVYDSDPKTNAKAKLLKHLTHKEIVHQNLRVMDLTAASLARDAHLKIEVFDMQGADNIVKVVNGKLASTVIE